MADLKLAAQIDDTINPLVERRQRTLPTAARVRFETIYNEIRDRICLLRYPPGHTLGESELAREFGISRTPMREALKVLAVEGLVTMKVRRGAYVTEMSADDVRQVYRLLGLLEADAAAEVAERASPAEIAELRVLHDKLEKQTRQRDAFFAANEQFHLRLLAIAGNRWRSQIVGDLRKVMKLNRHHSLFKQGRISDSLQEHRAVMQALERRDPEAAARLMREHFANGLAAATR